MASSYFDRRGFCPAVWSCPNADAASVRTCAALGFKFPDSTRDARVETFGDVFRGDLVLAMTKGSQKNLEDRTNDLVYKGATAKALASPTALDLKS